MLTTDRRYDIDWIRVIAIWLLLIYHTAIGFQPWGMMIGFITNAKPWTALWTPMAMLNVWRIPLLFFVSGMGVYFAIQNRNWKQVLLERTYRILVPLLFGIFFIVPIHIYIMNNYYGMDYTYFPHSAHLWFLGNIFAYILILISFFYYLMRNEHGKFATRLKKIMSHPIGLIIVICAFIIEVLIIKPQPYELYVKNLHGFFLGLLSFFFGFTFVFSGERFWKMIIQWRWLFLFGGLALFALRIIEFQMNIITTIYQLPIETICWILTVLAFGNSYLNHNSKTLQYLSQAAYPVYILHMVFLFLGSSIIFPLDLTAPLKFFLTLLFTFIGCYATYEIIRRIKVLRFLFGLKVNNKSAIAHSLSD
jgi:hypothetical protein